MAKYKLTELASVIRSKNSGPYELTFDVIFKDFETFYKVKEAQAINKQAVLLAKQTYMALNNTPHLWH